MQGAKNNSHKALQAAEKYVTKGIHYHTHTQSFINRIEIGSNIKNNKRET